jgi:hypothetical protein
MTAIPPGIAYILHLLPSVLIPIGAAYGTIAAARYYFQGTYPYWLDILATVASQPIIVLARGWLQRLRARRNAATMGAVFLPQLPDNSFQILRKLSAAFNDGYPGQCSRVQDLS